MILIYQNYQISTLERLVGAVYAAASRATYREDKLYICPPFKNQIKESLTETKSVLEMCSQKNFYPENLQKSFYS